MSTPRLSTTVLAFTAGTFVGRQQWWPAAILATLVIACVALDMRRDA